MPYSATKIDWANIDKGHVVYDPDSRKIIFFVPKDEKNFATASAVSMDDYPYQAIAVDPESGEKATWRWEVPITAGCEVELDTGQQAAVLFDYDGNGPWVQGQGQADGPYADVKCVGVVDEGSNSASAGGFEINALEPSDGSYDENSFLGAHCMIINPTASNFLAKATISDMSTATVDAAQGLRIYTNRPFSDGSTTSLVPNAGDKIAIGNIRWKRRTPQFYLGDSPRDTFDLTYAYIFFIPSRTDSNLYIQVYKDGSTTAESGWKARDEDGVTMVAGQSRILVSLDNADGFVKVPLGGQSFKTVEFEFESLEPNVALQLYRVEVEGRVEEERS